MENSFNIANLIVKEIKGTISPSEKTTLTKWTSLSPDNLTLYNKAISTKTQLDKLEAYQLFKSERVWSKLEKEVFQTKRLHITNRKWMLYAASILLPLLLTTSILIYLNKPIVNTLADIDTIITPGSQKAILVLSDGETLELDKEKLINEIVKGDVRINNKNNSLVYSSITNNPKFKEPTYNLLKTPRGGGYNLMLSDGTEVWLNAGSSLKFPEDFTDSIRKVFLIGEAYFKVKHNGKPFIVNSDKMDIRVLGTSFNVSAYADESEIKTTLVEGKVMINLNSNSVITSKVLTPNKQATINRAESNISIAEVNTSQYTSWLDGKLEFNNDNLDLVMKNLARWYDFEYEFQNASAKDFHFSARINNTESISTILEMLEMTTNVKFEMRNNTIIIL